MINALEQLQTCETVNIRVANKKDNRYPAKMLLEDFNLLEYKTP